MKIRSMLIPEDAAAYINEKLQGDKFYITIHETDNYSKTANANSHGVFLMKNNKGNTGWHFTVDDKEVVQHRNFKYVCFHAGDYNGNRNSIGIEMCVCEGMNLQKVRENTIDLIVWLINNYPQHFSVDRVVQHYYWSKKNCPTLLRRDNKWGWFISEINKRLNTNKKECDCNAHGIVVNADNLNVRQAPSLDGKILGTVSKGSKVSIVETIGEWHKIIYKEHIGYVNSYYVK